MHELTKILFEARDLLWRGPLLVALFGTGIFLTILLKGIQFRYLGHSIKLLFTKKVDDPAHTPEGENLHGDISGFQSLMTALAGAIGTGNITGIATAVMIGGFGAIFWMWVVAFIGMATAYSETILGVLFRRQNQSGEMSGGPMFVLLHGVGSPVLAAVFAVFGALACFGIGAMVQSNSVVDAVVSLVVWDRLILGCVLAALTASVVIGGIKGIGKVAGILVPFMAIAYILISGFILVYHYDRLPSALYMIIQNAFSGQAAVGGFLGATLMMAIQNGAQFGIFANEAGLGSLGIAGANAKTDLPAERGMLAICGVFMATMVICTLTGLVLAVTQIAGGTDAAGNALTGSPLALAAFGSVHNSFRYIVTAGLVMFAFTTILAWAYYGEKCFEFLFGEKSIIIYRWLYIGAVGLGAVVELDLVWAFSHLANGLMAFPNLFAVLWLHKPIQSETQRYIRLLNKKSAV